MQHCIFAFGGRSEAIGVKFDRVAVETCKNLLSITGDVLQHEAWVGTRNVCAIIVDGGRAEGMCRQTVGRHD